MKLRSGKVKKVFEVSENYYIADFEWILSKNDRNLIKSYGWKEKAKIYNILCEIEESNVLIIFRKKLR